jgi:hypothetical protein
MLIALDELWDLLVRGWKMGKLLSWLPRWAPARALAERCITDDAGKVILYLNLKMLWHLGTAPPKATAKLARRDRAA